MCAQVKKGVHTWGEQPESREREVIVYRKFCTEGNAEKARLDLSRIAARTVLVSAHTARWGELRSQKLDTSVGPSTET